MNRFLRHLLMRPDAEQRDCYEEPMIHTIQRILAEHADAERNAVTELRIQHRISYEEFKRRMGIIDHAVASAKATRLMA